MAGGEEGGRGRPRFLGPVGTALGVCRALCGSWEVSPPGQDQTPVPAWASETLASPGTAAQDPRGWG